MRFNLLSGFSVSEPHPSPLLIGEGIRVSMMSYLFKHEDF